MFFQNLSLRKLTLPDTITDIGERAFDQMFNISSINIPKSLETVEAHGPCLPGLGCFHWLQLGCGYPGDSWNHEKLG